MKKSALCLMLIASLFLCSCGARPAAPTPPETPAVTPPVPETALPVETEPDGAEALPYTLSYASGYANLSVLLPADWEGSVLEDKGDGGAFGVEFGPQGQDLPRFKLLYWPGGFGMCGTGVSFEKTELGAYSVTKASETIQGTAWVDWIFHDTAGTYTVQAEGDPELIETYAAVLDSVTVGVSCPSESEALAAAEALLETDYLRMDMPQFDYKDGSWLFRFYFGENYLSGCPVRVKADLQAYLLR